MQQQTTVKNLKRLIMPTQSWLNMQDFHACFTYSLILKLVAALFGLSFLALGLMIVVLDRGFDYMPTWAWRLFGMYFVVVGLLYLIPNQRFCSDEQVHYYIGLTLTNTLLLFLLLVCYTILAMANSRDWVWSFLMTFVVIPAALTAPASLVLHLIGARRRVME